MGYNPSTHVNTGTTAAIDLSNTSFTGNLVNSGTISAGTDTGIYILDTTTFAGGVVNQSGGTIAGGDYGIHITGVTRFGSSSVGGGITNSGTISGRQPRCRAYHQRYFFRRRCG